MSVARRSSSSVVNTTAGTSVTVSKPAGVVNGDFLLAWIAELGTGTITAPAGWTLVDSVSAGTALKLSCYRKVAASEGASWTWTLGASVRNLGSVHAFTGVDTSNPIASQATDGDAGGTFGGFGNDPVSDLPPYGYLAEGMVAANPASGSAITWTPNPDALWASATVELVDVSTNGGAGTDLCGCVLGLPAPDRLLRADGWQVSALTSVTTTDGAGIAVALNPTIGAGTYTGGLLAPKIEAAFGADPDGDPATWVWTDVTNDVRVEEGIRITKGRADEAGTAGPTQVTFSVNNPTGNWTPDHPTGSRYPNVDLNLPIRISLPYGYDNQSSKRATVFVERYAPRWESGNTRWSVVDISASGRLRRINNGKSLIPSPLYTANIGVAPHDYVPAAYWPMEDGSNARSVASAIAGVSNGTKTGTVTFASESDLVSSKPLPMLAAGATLAFNIPAYADTQQWVVQFIAKVPSEPATEQTLVEIQSTGTARRWVYSIAPGSPSSLVLRMYDSAGALISTNTNILDGFSNNVLSDATFYGHWVLHTISLADDGFGGGPTGWTGAAINSEHPGLGGTSAGAAFGIIKKVTCYGGSVGAGFGHLVVFTDPAFDVLAGAGQNADALLAFDGETTVDRVTRQCTERGVPVTSTWVAYDPFVAPSVRMGPQPRGTFAYQLRDIQSAELSLIHDGGPDGELVMDVRRHRYNLPVSLTIDMALSQLAVGFAPTWDDLRRVDDVTVSQPDGTSYRYSTSDSGEYVSSPIANVFDEDALQQAAGWLVRLGTVRGFRYPKISLNLRRSPEIAAAWLSCMIGHRVQAINLPSQHPSTTSADVIIEGYTEIISRDRWTVDLNVSPYEPYAVREWAADGVDTNPLKGRWQPDSLQLSGTVNAATTSWSVACEPQPFTTDPAHFPQRARLGGEQVNVTACASLLSATFGSSVSSAWPAAETGQSWDQQGGFSTDYSSTGGKGIHLCSTVSTVRLSTASLGVNAVDVMTLVDVDQLATGDHLYGGIGIGTDANNMYLARIQFRADATARLEVVKRVAGVQTTIAAAKTVGTYAAGTQYGIRLKRVGSTLWCRSWSNTAGQPAAAWTALIENEADLSVLTSLFIRSQTGSSSTNVNPRIRYDGITVLSPQLWTVQRAQNGVSKSHNPSTAEAERDIALLDGLVWAL